MNKYQSPPHISVTFLVPPFHATTSVNCLCFNPFDGLYVAVAKPRIYQFYFNGFTKYVALISLAFLDSKTGGGMQE